MCPAQFQLPASILCRLLQLFPSVEGRLFQIAEPQGGLNDQRIEVLDLGVLQLLYMGSAAVIKLFQSRPGDRDLGIELF